MLCPVCRTQMLTLEFEHIEIDYCGECGGAWLDSGEAALIGARTGTLQTGLLAALDAPGNVAEDFRVAAADAQSFDG